MLPSLALPIPTSPETIAFLVALADDEAEYQADVLTARRNDAGIQFVVLPDRLRQFLGGNTANTAEDYKRLRLNVCHIVVASVVDLLIVNGFDSDEAPQEQDRKSVV